jgi:hypothetical protein
MRQMQASNPDAGGSGIPGDGDDDSDDDGPPPLEDVTPKA